MNKKLLYAISLLTVYLLTISTTVSAHHYNWLVQDSRFQYTKFSGDESWASWWMINGVVTTTSVVSNPTNNITTNVTTALNNWNNSIPEVRFSGSGSDLVFEFSDSLCSATAGGCYLMEAVYNDTTRKANYITKGKAVITSNSTNRTRTAAHEIGHAIGLHEQYKDDGTSGCGSVDSIMNGGGCDTNTGPTSLDVFRVNNFLGNGFAQNIARQLSGTNPVLITEWEDHSYGELNYRVRLQKQQTNGSWSTVATNEVILNTGLVNSSFKSPALKPQTTFGLTNHGRGTYRVEVTPYFKSYNKYGIVTNSTSITW